MAGLVDFELLDARRNLPGVVLLGVIGTLVVAALALPFFHRPPAAESTLRREPEIQPVKALPLPPDGARLAELILQRPIFFDDRRLPLRSARESESEEPVEDAAVPPLDAALTGVIVTPNAKLAIVRFKGERRARVMHEGTSLDGELAAWRVAAVTPRGIQFTAADGQAAELELETHTASLAAPAAARPSPRLAAAAATAAATPNAKAGAGPAAGNDQASLADEVRRRIAERRAQLRAQREQLKVQEKTDNAQQ